MKNNILTWSKYHHHHYHAPYAQHSECDASLFMYFNMLYPVHSSLALVSRLCSNLRYRKFTLCKTLLFPSENPTVWLSVILHSAHESVEPKVCEDDNDDYYSWIWSVTSWFHSEPSQEGHTDPRWSTHSSHRPQSTSSHYRCTSGLWLIPFVNRKGIQLSNSLLSAANWIVVSPSSWQRGW